MYVVKHGLTNALVGEHKTKKKATEQAKEMQAAYEAAKALHDGQAVTFEVEKVEELPPSDVSMMEGD